MRSKPGPEDVIVGGCPDGFWSRWNCNLAARIGICSLVRFVDERPAELRDPDHVTRSVLGRIDEERDVT